MVTGNPPVIMGTGYEPDHPATLTTAAGIRGHPEFGSGVPPVVTVRNDDETA